MLQLEKAVCSSEDPAQPQTRNNFKKRARRHPPQRGATSPTLLVSALFLHEGQHHPPTSARDRPPLITRSAHCLSRHSHHRASPTHLQQQKELVGYPAEPSPSLFCWSMDARHPPILLMNIDRVPTTALLISDALILSRFKHITET